MPAPATVHSAIAAVGRRRAMAGAAALRLVALLLGLVVCAGAIAVRADSLDDRRVRTGARVFRATLAADTGIEARASGGRLPVLVYSGDARLGDEIGALIAPPDDPEQAQVRGLPLDVRVLDHLPEAADRPAALFIATLPSSDDLDRLVHWSIDRGVVLYSPFEGHVERGVMAGLSIEATVKPYVNLGSLSAGGIELKPFFLKVAKVSSE